MDNTSRLNLLQETGLSQTEAAVYLTLLTESPLTGYRIAEIIGKSRSNTYQALKTLEQKGCVSLSEGSDAAHYVAIPVETYLIQQELAFKARKKAVSDGFKDLKSNKQDNMIINLKTREQLITKAREMIASAKDIILLDTVDHILQNFSEDLLAVSNSGCKVLIESLGSESLPGCIIIGKQPNSSETLWPADWLVLSIDSREFLVAFLSKKGELINAVWVSNVFVSGWFASGMGYDFLIHHTLEMFSSERSREEIYTEINRFAEKYFINSRGYREMLEIMNNYKNN